MPVRCLSLLTALTFSLATGASHAGRPSVSENADVLDRGTCEVEPVVGSTRASGSPKVDFWDGTFTCGIGFSTQPFVQYSRARSAGLRIEGLAIGGKSLVIAPQGGRAKLTLGYGLFASKQPGASWETEGGSIDALATVELAKDVLMHANLGVERNRLLKQNTTLWSLGLERAGTLTLAIDLFGDDRTDNPGASVGTGYNFTERFSANAVYTTLLETPRLRTFSVGLKLVF